MQRRALHHARHEQLRLHASTTAAATCHDCAAAVPRCCRCCAPPCGSLCRCRRTPNPDRPSATAAARGPAVALCANGLPLLAAAAIAGSTPLAPRNSSRPCCRPGCCTLPPLLLVQVCGQPG